MRRSSIVGLVIVALTLTACGVPEHHKADKVDAADVPFDLLDQNRGSTLTDSTGEAVTVYLAKDGLLAAIPRRVGTPVTPERLLRALRRGPTKNEVSVGYRSALPETGTFNSVALDRGTARVDLSGPFTALAGADQTLALAQIVYTLTARPGIGSVRFTLEGATTEVPRGNGSLTVNRVSREDYRALADRGS
jgi:spore germination protein GerM